MGERSDVTDRDYVRNHRWGVAPSHLLGHRRPRHGDRSNISIRKRMTSPTSACPSSTASRQRSRATSDYGLVTDRFRSNVNIAHGTLSPRIQRRDVTSPTRCAMPTITNFDRFNAPNFGYDDSPGAPTPATPLARRAGRARLAVEPGASHQSHQPDRSHRAISRPVRAAHTLVAGTEFSRERDNTIRFVNPFGTAPRRRRRLCSIPNPVRDLADRAGQDARAITTAYRSRLHHRHHPYRPVCSM